MSQQPRQTTRIKQRSSQSSQSDSANGTTYVIVDEEPRWYTSWASWFWIFFCIFFVALFVIAIVALVNSNNNNDDFHHFSALTQRLLGSQQSSNDHSTLTSSLVALSSVFKSKEKLALSLCHRNVYFTETANQSDPLVALSESIEEMMNETMKEFYYYPLSVRLRMEFNVDPSEYGAVPKLRMRTNRKYMTLAYNITTKYEHFSTIKLQELEFAADERSIQPARTFTLCSNNVALNIRRCDGLVNRHNKLLLSDILITPLLPSGSASRPSPTGGQGGVKKTFAPTSAPTRIIVADKEMEDDDDYYTSEFSLINNNDALERDASQADEIDGIRVYNFVFYKEDKLTESQQKRETEKTTARVKPFKESIALIIEPNKC